MDFDADDISMFQEELNDDKNYSLVAACRRFPASR
jgi:hypothetical protein